MHTVSLSVVIPVFNESESTNELRDELARSLEPLNLPYEVLFIDDGSTDGTDRKLAEIASKDHHVKWIRFRSHFGKSAALTAGFKHATGSVIITMDGDLQDNPAEIPNFLKKLNEGYDVVSGWKFERKDSWMRRFLSRIYNAVTAGVSSVKLHDFNCGFKAYRGVVLREIHIYGELHRYIPLLAAWKGFRIAEQKVVHRPRKHGKSKYGAERILSGFLDLLTVIFLTRFTKKPAHFFGTIGLILTMAGLGIDGYIAYLRFNYGNIQSRYPLLFLGVLLTIVGVQFFSTGLLAELITYSQKKSELEYSVKDHSS